MGVRLVGALILMLMGATLAVLGSTWYQEYNTTYTLTVADVLNGRPAGLIPLGPGRKRASVTGFALRRQVQPVLVQTESGDVRTKSDRVFFPLRVPEDNRAILVSIPHADFDDNILLSETADQTMTFHGVIDTIPPARQGRQISQLFEDVTLPTAYCLVTDETGGRESFQYLAVAGGVLVVLGIALVFVKRHRPSGEPVQSEGAGGAPAAAGSALRDLPWSAAETTAENPPPEASSVPEVEKPATARAEDGDAPVCPHCQSPLRGDGDACWWCGQPLEKR